MRVLLLPGASKRVLAQAIKLILTALQYSLVRGWWRQFYDGFATDFEIQASFALVLFILSLFVVR